MIPKSSIRAFLQKPRADYAAWLDMSDKKIRRRMRVLPVRPPIWKKLRREQRICLLAGAATRRFAYFLDTGVGKTLLSLALMRYFKKAGLGRRFLVVVPNKVNITEWELEILKHTPKTKYCLLEGHNEEKLGQFFESTATIFVVTYAGLARMVSYLVEKKRKKKGAPKRRTLKVDMKLVNELARRLDGVFLDESVRVQNHRSVSFRVCRRLARRVDMFFILCATPFNRDPTSLWSQMFLVDLGETFGKTIGLFRAAFFKQVENYFSKYKDWIFDKTKRPEINRLLRNRSIRVDADASTLPKLVPITKEIELDGGAMAMYETAKKKLMASGGNIEEIRSHFTRMRQISSGFIGYDDDELGVRAQVELHPNRKLETLLSMVEEIAPDHKIVVYCDYTFSGSMICRELDKLKIGHGRIYGGTKDTAGVRKRFDADEDMRVLVLQNACGGFGLNLQIAKWGIYYESPVSAVMRVQTQRRIERQGSKHGKVFVADLLVKGTYDHRILEFHKDGKDLFEALIRGELDAPLKWARRSS